MRRTSLHIILLVATTVFVATASPLFAQGNDTTTVNCNSQNGDLQKALDNARIGSTVRVTGICAEGPYSVNRDTDLVGFSGGATLSTPAGSGDCCVLHVLAGSNIRDITIDATGRSVGINGEGGASVRLVNVVVENSLSSGLFLSSGSGASVFGSHFRNNAFAGVNASTGSASIFGGTFQDNGIGITARHSGGVSVTGSTISMNEFGILVHMNATAQVNDNTITSNTFQGIFVVFQGAVEITGPPNTFGGNAVDVRCESRGVIVASPQNGGTSSIDPSCILDGTLF